MLKKHHLGGTQVHASDYPVFNRYFDFPSMPLLIFLCRVDVDKAPLDPGHAVVVSIFVVLSLPTSLLIFVLQAVLDEPDTDVIIAMHTYEGKLSDLTVFKDKEPFDALLKWDKLDAKNHQPIVQEQFTGISSTICTTKWRV